MEQTTSRKIMGRKVMSVFLAIVMVLSVWVFVAPTKANAVDSGNYYVKITGKVLNKKQALWAAQNMSNSYTGWNQSKIDDGKLNAAGISVFYRNNNGTVDTENEVAIDIGKSHGLTGTGTLYSSKYKKRRSFYNNFLCSGFSH